MTLKILNSHEKKQIEQKLHEQFGIKKIDGTIIQSGKEKLYLFHGDFSEHGIKNLEKITFVEKIGLYFAKIMHAEEEKIKLSVEGTQIFAEQITKNIFELNKEQAEKWMQGSELNIKTGKKDFLIMKYQNDFLGCGKASAEKIGNFIPKNRRLKKELE